MMHFGKMLSLLAFVVCLGFSQPGGGIATQPASASDGPSIASDEKVEVVEEFWPDGTLMLRKHVLLLPDGTQVDHGTFERWHKNGKREYEAVFVRGKKEGTTIRYHQNGRPASRQEYRDGRRDGPSVSWDPAGNKVKEENWEDGRPHGTWTVWKDGEVEWSHTFEHGVPVSESRAEKRDDVPLKGNGS